MQVDQPFSNAGVLTELRYWFIKRIAGRTSVVLNTTISLAPPVGREGVQLAGFKRGALISGNTFLGRTDCVFRLTPSDTSGNDE